MKTGRVLLLVIALLAGNLSAEEWLAATVDPLEQELFALSDNREYCFEQKEMPIRLRSILWFLHFLSINGEQILLEPSAWSLMDQFLCHAPALPRYVTLITEQEAPQLHALVSGVALKTTVKKPMVLLIEDDRYDRMIGAFSLGWGRSILILGKRVLIESSSKDLQQYIAHEMGHIVYYHAAKKQAVKYGIMAALYGCIGLLCGYAFKGQDLTVAEGLTSIAMVSFASTFVDLTQGYCLQQFRRAQEFSADSFAVTLGTGVTDYLSAIKRYYESDSAATSLTQAQLADYAEYVLDKARKQCSADVYEYIKSWVESEIAILNTDSLQSEARSTHLCFDERVNYLKR